MTMPRTIVNRFARASPGLDKNRYAVQDAVQPEDELVVRAVLVRGATLDDVFFTLTGADQEGHPCLTR
jgi:hypothetical protein